MLPSTEIRWFFRQREDVAAIEAWFSSFGLTMNLEKFDREDCYLKLDGVSNLGLKIRESKPNGPGNWTGKLEAKVLVKEIGELKLEGGSSGIASQWTKFSFGVKEGDPALNEVINGLLPGVKDNEAVQTHWIKMEKNRLLIHYDLLQKRFVTNPGTLSEGCGVELTAIRISGKLYYSFSLEAFSTSGRHEQNFFETLNFLFSTLHPPGLTVENSYDYPRFLSGYL